MKICQGYRAFQRGEEEGFPKIIELFDQDRRVLSPAYYKFSRAPSTPHNSSRPWSIDFVSGAEIDTNGITRESKPIFMAKFGESPSRITFARQPISVGALLEVRAIASEIEAAVSAILTSPDEDLNKAEMHIANTEFNALAYDHSLLEYNAAAHIVSVQSGSKDLFLSCRLASALAFLALNMSRDDFEKIKVPKSFSDFGNRNRSFKKNMDRGYAFACLVFNGGSYNGDTSAYVEGCVSSSNLDSVESVLKSASKTLEKPVWFSNGNTTTSHFFRESTMSSHIMKTYMTLPQNILSLSTLLTTWRKICPPFIDSEANFIELNEGRLDEYRPGELHDASHALNDYTRNLMSGCRGI